MLSIDVLLAIFVFMGLMLAISLQGLAASGHFPREHRARAMATGGGPAILFGSIAVVTICLIVGIVTALRLIPWYAAIIGGGVSILSAPLVLQRFSDRFVDGRGSAITFTAASVALTLMLIWITMDR